MTNAKKRFVALLVAFTSIVSFIPLPFGLNGTEANAAVDTSVATKLDVAIGTTITGGLDKTDVTGDNNLYKTQNIHDDFFIVVPKKTVGLDTLRKVGDSGITRQEVVIKSIDGIEYKKDATDNILNEAMGIEIIDVTSSLSNYAGVKIKNLPLGVNKIEYTVRLEISTRVPSDNFVPTEENKVDPGVIKDPTVQEGIYPTLVIEHGNNAVQDQIHSIDFTNYIQGRDIDSIKNENIAPFRYDRTVLTSSNSLRYINSVPTSVTDLDYNIKISKGMFVTTGTDKDRIFVDGVERTNADVSESEDKQYTLIKDSLRKTSKPTMIVLAVNRKDAIQRSFSIEIKYDDEDAKDDYTLRNIGITKFNYNTDSNVKAFIGKIFTETQGEGDLAGVPIYSSTLNVDRLAAMISMEPTIGRNSSITAYKIYNTYDGGVSPGELKHGKIYVDFNKGLNNVINLEVYAGKDGSVTGTKPLAIYKFKVNVLNSQTSSEVNFSFNDDVRLTQPGRTPENSNIYEFSALRRTYDLHSDNDTIGFQLVNPYTYDKIDPDSSATAEDEFKADKVVTEGKIHVRREYVKAWVGNSVKSDNVKSVDVKILDKNDGKYSVEVGDAKKLVLQAYYDEVVYKTEEVTIDGNKVKRTVYEDGKPVEESRTSHSIGDKYTFYIAKNAENPDQDDTNSSIGSSNASLKNIEIKDSVLHAVDGTTGFSKDKNVYTATVPKEAKEAKITVTAEDKVKDISVKVAETGDEYGLESGDPFNFPLNKSGKTTLEVVVTSEDGSTTKLYTLTITNDSRSASAVLKNVYVDNGELNFDPDKSVNKVRVDLGVKKISITPVPEDVNSKVTVDGTKFNGSPISISLTGSQETTVKIEVTAEDGSASKTYKIEIYRTDSLEGTGNDDDDSDDSDIFYDEFEGCWVDTSKYEEWGKVKGKDVYFDKKGRQVKNAWIQTNNKWYYLNSSGYKTSGWRTESDGKSYYLDPTTGELRTGWLNLNGSWYYLGLNGVMHKRWLNLNANWYYFTDQGVMIVNQTMSVDGQVYRFGADGAIY